MAPALTAANFEPQPALVDNRTLLLCLGCVLLAIAAALTAQVLTRLISFCTQLAFYGRLSTEPIAPAGHHLGPLVIAIPIVGGLIVGVMARYGSKAIRGHGIPEAMEQILTNRSKIPARLTFLKPLSAAISIGTGGPFGAEGPIIATGGALGSVLGQLLKVTASERKTLLAAGAAAGMAATFGAPVSAVLLAMELLLFEYRARSLIPVALATATATSVRIALNGNAPMFAMPNLITPQPLQLAGYVLIGALVGLCAVAVTRAVYAIEDGFSRLPIHWMWWPALGAIAVGVVGFFEPRTMGVGYDNIEQIISGQLLGWPLVILGTLKFISWSISLGSGTSGGTLAPLFTLGGATGVLFAMLMGSLGWHLDPKIAGLVGMAAMFAGASRALLASVVFAFETTRQEIGLLPLLGGCSAAYLISCLTMRHSIMTEKIARRGVKVAGEWAVDILDRTTVGDCASRTVHTLHCETKVSELALSHHQGYPVVEGSGELVGMVTLKDLHSVVDPQTVLRQVMKSPARIIFSDSSLRQAVDKMGAEGIGRLPVVDRTAPNKLVGILSRSDILAAFRRQFEEHHHRE